MDRIDVYNLKGLLLDLDGMLINSEKAFFNSFRKVLEERFGITITIEDYKKYELEQNARLLLVLREEKKLPDNFSDSDIMQLIYSDYLEEFKKVILEDEARDNFELLKQLKELKIKLALVTTCRRFYLDILIERLGLDNLFDFIVAREDVENLKPAPDAYIMALDYLELAKHVCLALEDSKRGIDASLASGLLTIQVSNFTSIKYTDERAINCESANQVLRKILAKKNETR